MRNWSNWTILFLSSLLLITQFVNCDTTAENNLFKALDSNCVDTGTCNSTNKEFLELKINTENNTLVKPGETNLNVGGDCNEGGFPANVIIWELYLDDVLVADSQSLDLNTVCELGKFTILVALPRAGLQDAQGTPREHRLYVEIIGFDEEGSVFENDLLARKSIILTPSP